MMLHNTHISYLSFVNENEDTLPCLQGSGVKFAVDDRGSRAGFIKIRTDDVMVQTTSSVANPKCNAELLDFLSQSLALRRSNLSVRHSLCMLMFHSVLILELASIHILCTKLINVSMCAPHETVIDSAFCYATFSSPYHHDRCFSTNVAAWFASEARPSVRTGVLSPYWLPVLHSSM